MNGEKQKLSKSFCYKPSAFATFWRLYLWKVNINDFSWTEMNGEKQKLEFCYKPSAFATFWGLNPWKV